MRNNSVKLKHITMSFQDKVVIVTGASAGIGAATAEGFSKEGAKVVIVGRNETRLAEVATRCNNPLVIRADVTSDEDAANIINQTIEKFGQLDILVNNAGICGPGGILDENIMETYDFIMNLNIRAVIRLTSLAAPHLIKTKGNIVNISSVSGELSSSMTVVYSVSKASLNHFSVCAAVELAPHGVRVNTVSPGPVRTDIFETSGFIDKTSEDFKTFTILDRVSEPEEIADLILFLASDKAQAITGSNYVSDNGVLIKR